MRKYFLMKVHLTEHTCRFFIVTKQKFLNSTIFRRSDHMNCEEASQWPYEGISEGHQCMLDQRWSKDGSNYILVVNLLAHGTL